MYWQKNQLQQFQDNIMSYEEFKEKYGLEIMEEYLDILVKEGMTKEKALEIIKKKYGY